MNIAELFYQLDKSKLVNVKVGNVVVPTKELINVHYTVEYGMEFNNHLARKLNLNYVRKELDWYIKADRYDTSILGHAKIWSGCVASDGGINSNYGQYLFGSCGQLSRVVKELERDSNSRRAVAMILGQNALHFAGIDQPCTLSAQFLVRESFGFPTLDCIVNMRSQDAIFGLGNDIPAFMFLLNVVASALEADYGKLHVNVGSFHVYERHFSMLERIAREPSGWYRPTRIPELDQKSAWKLIDGYGYELDTDFGKWMRGLHT